MKLEMFRPVRLDECEAGDLIYTKVRSDSGLSFIFDVGPMKCITYFYGEVRFCRHELTNLSKTSHRYVGASFEESLRFDNSLVFTFDSHAPMAGDLFYDRGRWGLVIDFDGEAEVIGINGRWIRDPWSSTSLIMTNWQIVRELSGSNSDVVFSRVGVDG